MKTLYHGSNMVITDIDLVCCKPFRDFGRGFYLTDIFEQAEQMAERKVKITGAGEPCVTSYAFDEDELMTGELRVKCFDKPTEEWAMFILSNRRKVDFRHNYDVVIGPVADDGVALQLDRYERHFISLSTLVQELTYRRLNRQYYFGTPLAISKLKRL